MHLILKSLYFKSLVVQTKPLPKPNFVLVVHMIWIYRSYGSPRNYLEMDQYKNHGM